MANILSYIQLVDGDASPSSLWVLNHGRFIANQLGAALYAVLPCTSPPTYDENDIITVISRYGADKVILLTNPGMQLPASEDLLEQVLGHAGKRFPPRLVLLPEMDHTPKLGERLARLIGGEARSVEIPGVDGEASTPSIRDVSLLLSREALLQTRSPLVVTVGGTPTPRIVGEDDTEVVVVQTPLDSSVGGESTTPS